MKKYLLPENGKFYKANLHCHSTVSDGTDTPQRMKEYYKSQGYSILSITDHELLVDHSDLNDDDFLTITGYEYAFVEDKDYPHAKTLELNLYAKDPHNETQICFNPKNVIHGEKWRCDTLKYTGDIYERNFSIESIQHVIDEAKKNGFLVSLNHPSYSFITPEFFGNLKGLFAMEIHNQASFYYSNDFNPHMYDDMLRRGHKLHCLASDDNHCASIFNDEVDLRPWGFTMIKSENLNYDSVISAIQNGDFYSSQGPLIHELYIENNQIHIKCSDAKAIIMRTKYRFGWKAIAPCREVLNEAVFPLPDDEYMRFEVIDAFGRYAATNAYYLK